MDDIFTKRCDKEIKENKHKGVWKNFKPSRKKIIQEMMWHIAKLNAAVFDDSVEHNHHGADSKIDKIQEYSADIANICEKIFTLAESEKSEFRVRHGEYGQSMGYREIGWPYAYSGE